MDIAINFPEGEKRMPDSAISTIFIIFAVTIIPMIISSRAKRSEYKYAADILEDEKFLVSRWVYAINYCGILVPMLFFGSALYGIFTLGVHWFDFILILVGLIFTILLIYILYLLPKTYVLIQDGVFTYFDGRKEKVRVNLDDIRYVYVSGGSIVIDDGGRYRKVVPLYFQKSAKIVLMLKIYRP